MESKRNGTTDTTRQQSSDLGDTQENAGEVRAADSRIIYKTSHGVELPAVKHDDGYGIHDCNVAEELNSLRTISSVHIVRDLELYSLMVNTMYNEFGVGLAAPQIGLNERLIVMDYHWPSNKYIKAPMVLINPEVLEKSDEEQISKEACLSVPGLEVQVTRAKRIKLKARTLPDQEILIEESDYGAAVIQHELDHLQGLLLIDYLSSLRRDMYKKKIAKMRKRARIIAQQSLRAV